MKPIAIFYHCLFQIGDEILNSAIEVVSEQMKALKDAGLVDAASEMFAGVNGGHESRVFVESILPAKVKATYHGLESRNENLTIVMLEEWLKEHNDWHVLYFHSKGSTHGPGDPLHILGANWRRCLMRGVVDNWKTCVADLESGYDSVGSHWMPGMCDGTQNIWAGNFWWATSNFLRTVPSIYLRDRIKVSGIKSMESRYESEVWLGNAPRLPRVKDYHPVLFNVHAHQP